MDFGAFILAQQRGYHQNSHDVIANSVEQTVKAEQAGFSNAWYAEHHFNNYSLSPSPLMMVAHCAGLTSTIRLGSAVCILPLYHAPRFLAEVGFVDSISNGRLELGIGSGYQQFEFERFGTSLEDSGRIFEEYLDVIPKALKQKIFEHHSEYLDIPPSSIAVRPVQSPMPPIWVTTGNPKLRERAFREGYNLFVTALLNGKDGVHRLRGQLDEAIANSGSDGSRTRIGFLRCAYASDNRAEIDSYLENARFQRRLSFSLKERRQQTDDGYLMKEVPTEGEPTIDDLRANLPVGSVNQVIDSLLAEIEILKPDHIALQTQLGDFDQKTMLKQMDLWGEKIIPAIQKEVGAGPYREAAE
ncbi:LLM class flavin-dependent oxidoreductase [Martelella mediterranea]|uniref:Alkanal monooxygenase alpha chain n=1 Tax=Martelella mediterranea DSM 17316 TaxID=1122214 RepID=A0A1U9Z5T1_9HYPH|nr:LLM class flavin-dependent oxidoreductase [Martelella mediterranea]AQZ53041.1 Alkanal monooxygenase alpha chain [Martelella mediterranea DSM 17316]